MNRRFLTILFLVGAAAMVHAQDKAATPKSDKGGDKPKVLIFQPDTKVPAVIPESGVTQGVVVQRAPQTNPMLDGPSQIVANFFGAMRDQKIDEGYATLTRDSNIAEKPEQLKQLKAKTREAIEVFGAIIGYDFVESRSIGQRLVRATYVSQGKIFPLRWRFYFYKPEGSWRLIDMRVDDKLTGIFDEVDESKSTDLRTGLPSSP
jgi:hypothetical protein